jgi:cell division initiation protein
MLTPTDIENKVFKKAKFGGYEIKDVEDFLESLIVDYEELFKKVTELNDKCENLQESVLYYKSVESGIEQTIGNAKEEADIMRERALKDIERFKKEKEDEMNDELEIVKAEIKARQSELDDVKKEMKIYKIRIKSMLEAQLKILEETEE